MTKMTDQQKIDEIMDWFEFDRVAKTMETLDWKWAGRGFKNDEVPTEPEIRKMARDLLRRTVVAARNSTYPEKPYECGTGGFTVRVDGPYITLSFAVAEWTTGHDCNGDGEQW